jgi:hypothetical protein
MGIVILDPPPEEEDPPEGEEGEQEGRLAARPATVYRCNLKGLRAAREHIDRLIRERTPRQDDGP